MSPSHHVTLVPVSNFMQLCLSFRESMLTVRIILFMVLPISSDECGE